MGDNHGWEYSPSTVHDPVTLAFLSIPILDAGSLSSDTAYSGTTEHASPRSPRGLPFSQIKQLGSPQSPSSTPRPSTPRPQTMPPYSLYDDPAFSSDPREHPHFVVQSYSDDATNKEQHTTPARDESLLMPPGPPPVYSSTPSLLSSPSASSQSSWSPSGSSGSSSGSSHLHSVSPVHTPNGSPSTPHAVPAASSQADYATSTPPQADPPAPHNHSEPLLRLAPTTSSTLPTRPSSAPLPPSESQPQPQNQKQPKQKHRRHFAQELDRIDELDETDPRGLAWHHGGPYEAIAVNLQRQQRNRPAAAQAPVIPGNPFALNLAPGQVLPRNALAEYAQQQLLQAQYQQQQQTEAPGQGYYTQAHPQRHHRGERPERTPQPDVRYPSSQAPAEALRPLQHHPQRHQEQQQDDLFDPYVEHALRAQPPLPQSQHQQPVPHRHNKLIRASSVPRTIHLQPPPPPPQVAQPPPARPQVQPQVQAQQPPPQQPQPSRHHSSSRHPSLPSQSAQTRSSVYDPQPLVQSSLPPPDITLPPPSRAPSVHTQGYAQGPPAHHIPKRLVMPSPLQPQPQSQGQAIPTQGYSQPRGYVPPQPQHQRQQSHQYYTPPKTVTFEFGSGPHAGVVPGVRAQEIPMSEGRKLTRRRTTGYVEPAGVVAPAGRGPGNGPELVHAPSKEPWTFMGGVHVNGVRTSGGGQDRDRERAAQKERERAALKERQREKVRAAERERDRAIQKERDRERERVEMERERMADKPRKRLSKRRTDL